MTPKRPHAIHISVLLLFLFTGLLFSNTHAHSTPNLSNDQPQTPHVVVLTDNQQRYQLGQSLEFLLDETRHLTLKEVVSEAYRHQFVPSQVEIPNFGLTQEAVWVRFRLEDHSKPGTTWQLALDFLPLSQISFFRPTSGGTDFENVTTGWTYPFKSRDIHHNFYVFDLPFPSADDQVYYLRITSDNTIRLPLSVYTREALAERTLRDYLRFGLFYGALLMVVGYNFLLFIKLRERGYLEFVLFLLFFMAGQATLDGLTQQYLWPDWPWWNLRSSVIFFSLAGISALQFLATQLETLSFLPRWHILIRGAQFSLLLASFLALVNYSLGLRLMIVLLSGTVLLIILVSSLRLRQGFITARYYLMGWLILTVSGFAILFTLTGMWQGANWVEYGYNWSVVVLALLLSMALVDRINALRWEAEAARQAVSEHSRLLEAHVDSRTAELSTTIRELKQQVSLRQQAESHLRESELRFRTLFENAPLGIAIAKEGRFTYVNKVYIEMFGFTDATQMIGTLVSERIAPVNQPSFIERARRRVQGLPVESRYELTCVRSDGSQFPVLAAANLVQLEEGMVTIGFFQDINERIQIEQAERKQRALAEALRDTAASLNSTLEVEDVLDNILVNAGRVVAHNAANVMMIDAYGEAHVVRYRTFDVRRYGEDIQKLRFQVAEVPTFRTMWETGLPLIVSDTRKNPDWVRYDEIGWIGSYAGIPILQKGKVVGFINLDSETPGFYTADQIDLLHAFADQAAVALENARLYQQAQHHARQMTSLYELGLSITAQLDQSQLILELGDKIQDLLNPHVYYIAIYDEENHQLNIPYFNNEGEQLEIPSRNLIENTGLSGEVLINRRTLVINDLQDPQQRAQPQIELYNPEVHNRTYVATPMLVREHVIGLISIQSRQPNAYTHDQVQLLETIAAQAAVAIENSLLFERAQDEIAQRRSAQDSLEQANQQLHAQILQIEALQTNLREQAIRDPLTGLFNRRYLEETLLRELGRANREGSPVGLIFMDIDHFKAVNDTYGHTAGDRVLENLADLIHANIRAEDIACRFGGEEFIISMPGASSDTLYQRAEQIRARFDTHPLVYQGQVVQATLSIGTALYPQHASDATQLLQRADHALYLAKQAGRNRVVMFDASLE